MCTMSSGKDSMLNTLVVPQRRSSANPLEMDSQVIVVGERALEVIDPADPMGKSLLLENGAAHDREVQMAVRIDEPGHENAIAKVFDLPARKVACAAHSNDPPAVQDGPLHPRSAARQRQDDA